jgi:hypothetical protein
VTDTLGQILEFFFIRTHDRPSTKRARKLRGRKHQVKTLQRFYLRFFTSAPFGGEVLSFSAAVNDRINRDLLDYIDFAAVRENIALESHEPGNCLRKPKMLIIPQQLTILFCC